MLKKMQKLLAGLSGMAKVLITPDVQAVLLEMAQEIDSLRAEIQQLKG